MDWTDLLTKLAPFVVACVSVIFAYVQTKDNNRSRRLENEANIAAKRQENESANKLKLLELTYAERLKAFSEMLAVIQSANRTIQRFYWQYKRDTAMTLVGYSADSNEVSRQDFFACFDAFDEVYNKNKLYLPKSIDNAIVEYERIVMDSPSIFYGVQDDDPNGIHEVLYVKTEQSFDEFFDRVIDKKDQYLIDIKERMQSFLEI